MVYAEIFHPLSMGTGASPCFSALPADVGTALIPGGDLKAQR